MTEDRGDARSKSAFGGSCVFFDMRENGSHRGDA